MMGTMRSHLPSLILLATMLIGACSTPYVSNWSQVRRGMTETEVLDLLGPPRTRFIAADEVISEDKAAVVMGETEAELGYAERWVYGEHPLGITSGLEQGLKYRAGSAYHVYFDHSGRVINAQAPEPERLEKSFVTEEPY